MSVAVVVLLVVLGVLALGGGSFWAYSELVAVTPSVDPPEVLPDRPDPTGTSEPTPSGSGGTASGSGAEQSGSGPPPTIAVPVLPVPPERTAAAFSVHGGKVSLAIPATWSRDGGEDNYIVASRASGTGTGNRIVLILSDMFDMLPMSIDELHELNLTDIYFSSEPDGGFEVLEEEWRDLPNGMSVMTTIVRESSVEDPVHYLLITAIHNGHACWIQFSGRFDVASEVDSEVDAIIDSLRIVR